jgi:hypothetical protein
MFLLFSVVLISFSFVFLVFSIVFLSFLVFFYCVSSVFYFVSIAFFCFLMFLCLWLTVLAAPADVSWAVSVASCVSVCTGICLAGRLLAPLLHISVPPAGLVSACSAVRAAGSCRCLRSKIRALAIQNPKQYL